MYQVVIVAFAIGSGWSGSYAINPEYPSCDLCEPAQSASRG
jgi:hypothetical protein